MKVVFIAGSAGTLFLIFHKFKSTRDRENDVFRIEILLIPCLVLAMLVNYDFTVIEVSETMIVNLI